MIWGMICQLNLRHMIYMSCVPVVHCCNQLLPSHHMQVHNSWYEQFCFFPHLICLHSLDPYYNFPSHLRFLLAIDIQIKKISKSMSVGADHTWLLVSLIWPALPWSAASLACTWAWYIPGSYARNDKRVDSNLGCLPWISMNGEMPDNTPFYIMHTTP